MSHHYTKDTTSAPSWCNKCDKYTEHIVSDGRLGRCKDHEVQRYSKAQLQRIKEQEEAAKNPKLF